MMSENERYLYLLTVSSTRVELNKNDDEQKKRCL